MLMNLVAIIPLLVMLVIFIGQAIWVARDAMKKGEEFWWLWTIISVIVFPIGIIIYILVSRNNKNICNNCGKATPKNTNACPYCGISYNKTCPSCGEKVERGWQYCANCAEKLPEGMDTTKNNKGVSKNQKLAIAVVIAVFLIVISTPVITFIEYLNIGNHYEEVVVRNDYFCNQQFEEEHTGTRSYTMSPTIINYEGKIKSGSVVIKSYDSSGNLLQESQVIKEKNAEGSFNTGYGGEKVKVTVEFTDFKGEFKMYR